MQENKPVNPQEDEAVLEIDILAILDACKRHISEILILALLGGLLGYACTLFFVTPRYKATSSMFVVSASVNSAIDLTDINLGTRLAGDYVELVQSRTMLERVLADTGDPLTVEQLSKMLSVTNVEDTRILTFTVTSSSPQQAMRLSNGVLKQAIEFLPFTMNVKDNPPREIDLAILPTHPYNMNYLRNIALGCIAGAIVMMGICALRVILNDRMDRSEDVEKLCGFAPLAVIPENNQQQSNRSSYYYYYYSNADKDKEKQ